MAGDWIKMRVGLAEEPEVIAMADALGVDEDFIVGKLHRFWSWADSKTTDGNAPSVTKKWVDRFLKVDGFADALVSVGWLQDEEGGILIPSFNTHMGQSAKRRALTSKRVANHKEKTNAKGNAPSVSDALPREEKRREDIESSSKEELSCQSILKNGQRRGQRCGALGQVQSDGVWYCLKHAPKEIPESADFDMFWEACPKKTAKAEAWSAWSKALKTAEKSQKRMTEESVAEFLTRRMFDYGASVADKDSRYIRNPATWLNGGNWDDEVGSRVATAEQKMNWRP